MLEWHIWYAGGLFHAGIANGMYLANFMLAWQMVADFIHPEMVNWSVVEALNGHSVCKFMIILTVCDTKTNVPYQKYSYF